MSTYWEGSIPRINRLSGDPLRQGFTRDLSPRKSAPRVFSHREFVNIGPSMLPMCHAFSYESSPQTVMRTFRAYRCIWLRLQIYFIVGCKRQCAKTAYTDRIICTRNPKMFNLILKRVIKKIIERGRSVALKKYSIIWDRLYFPAMIKKRILYKFAILSIKKILTIT